MKSIFNSSQDSEDLISEIGSLAQTARQQSILALEKVEIKNRYLGKAVRYMVDGYDPAIINGILATDFSCLSRRHSDARKIYENLGEACPAFGMIGTVIGLIVIMANLSDPDKIGPGLAVALITTLYGSLIANMVFIPIAQKLKYRSEEERLNIKIIMSGINGILNGESPRVIQDRLQAFLEPHKQDITGG